MTSRTFVGVFMGWVLATALGAQTITSLVPPVIGFVDLSTNGGTALTSVLDNSEHNVWSTVGNTLFTQGLVRISPNGVAVALATTGDVLFNNTAIPAVGVPFGVPGGSGVICAFWDDLFPVTAGAPPTSIYTKDANGVFTIMWKDAYHTGEATNGQAITFEVQIFDSPAPGAPDIQILYPDTTFGGSAAAFDSGASATIGYIAGVNPAGINMPWSFNTASVPGGTVLSIFAVTPPMLLAASSPWGPGSLELDIAFGPPNGTYFFAVTLVPGNYPNGWLFGLDISYAELAAQFGSGFPFSGPLAAAGDFSLGPFPGLPPMTIQAIAFGFAPGSQVPSAHTDAISHTIP